MIGSPLMAVAMLASPAMHQEPPVAVGPITGSKPFDGGPLAGLRYGDVVDPAGQRFKGLLASSPNASPIDAIDRAAISALIAGHDDGGKKPLKDFLTHDAKFISCSQRGRPCADAGKSLRFGEPCRANTPYRMTDGTVRIEWLYGSALYYISKVKLRSGKITFIETSPAWAPIVIGARTDTQ